VGCRSSGVLQGLQQQQQQQDTGSQVNHHIRSCVRVHI
jgi:hypothetical protein